MSRIFSMCRYLAVFTLFFALASAWNIRTDSDRRKCQKPSKNALDGCDAKRTLLVDQSNPEAKFQTVQSAVASLPNNTDTYIILIATGNYTEQVNVTRVGPTYLLGQTKRSQSQAANTVNIIWRAVAGTTDNAYTSTLTVAPNLNASFTGSGPTGFAVPEGTPFGSSDFRTYNLNFINDFAPRYAIADTDVASGPSLALSISRANGGFYYTGFYSYQDTVYVGKLGNAYLSKGVVAGQTDFFYGFGTAWVTKTDIQLRSCGGGITAWKGTNTTFPNKYGVYITDSHVHKANSSLNIVGKCPLGRPWNALHRSIFSHNYLDDSILPAGYIDWNPARYIAPPRPLPLPSSGTTVFTLQAEFENHGPGWNASARADSHFDSVLTRAEEKTYRRAKDIFQFPNSAQFGNDAWVHYGA